MSADVLRLSPTCSSSSGGSCAPRVAASDSEFIVEKRFGFYSCHDVHFEEVMGAIDSEFVGYSSPKPSGREAVAKLSIYTSHRPALGQ